MWYLIITIFFCILFTCAQGCNLMSLWKGLSSFNVGLNTPMMGRASPPRPPNIGKKRGQRWREIRFHRDFDGIYFEHFSPAASPPPLQSNWKSYTYACVLLSLSCEYAPFCSPVVWIIHWCFIHCVHKTPSYVHSSFPICSFWSPSCKNESIISTVIF